MYAHHLLYYVHVKHVEYLLVSIEFPYKTPS